MGAAKTFRLGPWAADAGTARPSALVKKETIDRRGSFGVENPNITSVVGRVLRLPNRWAHARIKCSVNYG